MYGDDRRFREPTADEVASLTTEQCKEIVSKYMRPDNIEVRHLAQPAAFHCEQGHAARRHRGAPPCAVVYRRLCSIGTHKLAIAGGASPSWLT